MNYCKMVELIHMPEWLMVLSVVGGLVGGFTAGLYLVYRYDLAAVVPFAIGVVCMLLAGKVCETIDRHRMHRLMRDACICDLLENGRKMDEMLERNMDELRKRIDVIKEHPEYMRLK